MLSIKRLFQIILIIIFIGVALLANISTFSDRTFEITNDYGTEVAVKNHQIPMGLVTDEYFVVGNSNDLTEKMIKENVILGLQYMKLKYVERKALVEKDLLVNPILIFTVSEPSKSIDLKLLGDFISNGGRVLFAAGLPENYTDSYLYPAWGIVEKGNKIATNKFHIFNNFMPYPEVTLDYNGHNASTVIKLKDTVKVYIEDEKKVPIVYSNNYEEGKIVVINGSLLDNKYSGGILSGALGKLKGQMLYPIIGTKTVFLDDFPPNNANDKNSAKLYGRSAESFIRDVLWPTLLGNMTVYELKYTAGLYTDNKFLYNNERFINYLSKEIMRYSGELIFLGDFSKLSDSNINYIIENYNKFKKLFPKYHINGYSVLFGKVNDKTLNEISTAHEKIYTLRGVYDGDINTQMVQNFGFKDGFVNFPVISHGYTKKNGDMFRFLSGLSLQGVISHDFDIGSLLTADSKETSWDGLKLDYNQLNIEYFGNTKWLQPKTLSEAGKNVKAYSNLKLAVRYNENQLKAYCDYFMEGQAFFLQTDREILNVDGGSFTGINNSYYIIHAKKEEFTVIYK